MAMHGMDIGAVRNMGQRLQNQHSESIKSLMTEIEGMVNDTSATWVGPDAEKFRGWWPEKRRALMAIADDLHGFGQSALNNATEQENTSGR